MLKWVTQIASLPLQDPFTVAVILGPSPVYLPSFLPSLFPTTFKLLSPTLAAAPLITAGAECTAQECFSAEMETQGKGVGEN